MACFQITRSGLSPAASFRSGAVHRGLSSPVALGVVRCRLKDGGENESKGEELPESLFMKELKRRGMGPTPTPTSLLEDGKRRRLFEFENEEVEAEEEEEVEERRGGEKGKKRSGVASAKSDKDVDDQRVRSMALNSEGLEGLIPRAKVLLTTGGTFFLGFLPLILITVAIFSALYFYFGPSFVHDASKMPLSPPPYVDPYALLEDERISQIARR